VAGPAQCYSAWSHATCAQPKGAHLPTRWEVVTPPSTTETLRGTSQSCRVAEGRLPWMYRSGVLPDTTAIYICMMGNLPADHIAKYSTEHCPGCALVQCAPALTCHVLHHDHRLGHLGLRRKVNEDLGGSLYKVADKMESR